MRLALPLIRWTATKKSELGHFRILFSFEIFLFWFHPGKNGKENSLEKMRKFLSSASYTGDIEPSDSEKNGTEPELKYFSFSYPESEPRFRLFFGTAGVSTGIILGILTDTLLKFFHHCKYEMKNLYIKMQF
jgi:hypothetical protein